MIYAQKMYMFSELILVGIVFNVALNIPFIIKWGMLGAAWATTISGVKMGFVTYFVAQKYVKIVWQWRTFWSIYAVFSLAVAFAFIESQYLNMSYYWAIIIKLLLIMLYFTLGFKLQVVTVEKVKRIFKI